MKHYVKKAIIIILSITLISSLCISFVNAEYFASNSDNDLITFTQAVLPEVLSYHNIQPLDDVSIILGQSIPSYRVESNRLFLSDYEIYPLFINDRIFSLVRKYTGNDGGIIYSCRLDAREISNIDSSQGAFIYLNNELLLISPSSFNASSSSADKSLLLNNIKNIATIDFASISAQAGTQINPSTITTRASYVENDQILIDRMYNVTSSNKPPCCNKGICWAACFASIANEFGNVSYASAMDYHDSSNCLLFHSDYLTYTIDFLNDDGVSTGNYNYNGLSYNMMQNYVNASSVALLCISNYTYNYMHYVVGYGYYKTTSYLNFLRYMDPNEGYCTVQFPASGTLALLVNGLAFCEDFHLRCY